MKKQKKRKNSAYIRNVFTMLKYVWKFAPELFFSESL